MTPGVGGERSSTVMFEPASLATALNAEIAELKGAELCVAYSGGMDSHVLVHALCALRVLCGFRLRALHIDHRLHPDSGEWAEHCRMVCARLAVDFHAESVRVEIGAGRSLENEARRARYACLASQITAGQYLLTAHHRDDQAETVLLMLMRGSGVRGTGGMRSQQRFGKGRLLRPLLGVGRAELAAYAAAEGLSWIDDASNRDTRYSRNFVRHVVLPALAQHWPEAAGTLVRYAVQAREASGLLDALAREDVAPCRVDCPGVLPISLGCLSVSALRRLPEARIRNAVRLWLRDLGLDPPPSRRLAEAVSQLVMCDATGCPRVEWADAVLRRYRDALIAGRCLGPPPRGALAWSAPEALPVPWAGVQLTPRPVTGSGLARAVWERSVTVAPRRRGESCRPAGAPHHRRLKNLFQELGIPPWERERLPLVYVDGQLAWLPGIGACAAFAAGAGEPGIAIELRTDSDDLDAQFH
jgi:tRNA(Ile)-lysidine synthase